MTVVRSGAGRSAASGARHLADALRRAGQQQDGVRFPSSYEELRLERSKGGGSGDARLMRDQYDVPFVVKADGTGLKPGAYVPPGHVAEEVLTDDGLRALGVPAAPSIYITDAGGTGYKASLFIEDGQPSGALLGDPRWGPAVREMAAWDFPAHALLANWDAYAKRDNMLVRFDPQGELESFYVDTGGGLRRRSRGELKGDRFGPLPLELWTMRAAPEISGRPNHAREYIGDLRWFQIVDAMDDMLTRRDDLLAAMAPEPEVQGPLASRMDAMRFLVEATRALQARGMDEAQMDGFLRQLMESLSPGQPLPDVGAVLARAGLA